MQLLEQHFDAAFAAPDGIKKLRELILTLAMQGKLVEQDPSDQPASELLEEIEQEKRRLVAAGKIKAPKPLPVIEADEVPYEVPTGWEWIRLGEFLEMFNGFAFKPTDWIEKGLPIIRIQNLNSDRAPFNYCDPQSAKPQNLVFDGDLLISWSGTPGTSFGAFIWNRGEGVLNQHIFKCKQIGRSYITEFLQRSINNRLDYLISQAQGAVGLQHVTKGTLERMLLPLPPRAEQRRIVARIDELMARCDELEALRAEREQKRLDAHAAALNALLGAQEPAAFADAWQFITQHFSDLHSVPKNVAELRKAVLQLAVMGKLVEQDPNDPPASELLKEIQEDKNRLIVAGKIRASKSLPPVTPEEMPYQVPGGWEWVRLGDLALASDSGWSPQCLPQAREGNAWGVLKVSAVSWGEFRPAENKALPDGLEIRPDAEVRTGDFLISRANTEELVARSVIVNEAPIHLMMSDKIVRFLLSDFINKKFVNVCNGASYARLYYASNASGTSSSMKNVSREVMSNLPVPLPPLPEQRRIVAKIDQLMALCNQLETALASQTGSQSALLASVMAAVTPASAAPTRRAAPARASAGETVRRGPGRPRKEVAEASSEHEGATVVRRKPGRPRKEPAEAVAVEGTPVMARRGPGRPRKNSEEPTRSIPEAASETDAIRRLEVMKVERAQGTRQVGLFDPEV